MFMFDRLDALVEQSGRSYKFLCDAVGQRRSYITQAKGRGSKVPAEYVSRWAEILGTTPAYLLGETDDPAPSLSQIATSSDQFPPEVQELLQIAEKDPVALDAMLAVARAIVARRDDKK